MKDKIMKCVAIGKQANGTAQIVFHELAANGDIVTVLTIQTKLVHEADQYTHMGIYFLNALLTSQ